MSRLHRLGGVLRSLAIYHGIPFRQRRMRRLYAQLVRPGDLVFDIGAHVGNRTRALASLGCRVVAVEPQPGFARLLRILFAPVAGVTVVAAAVGESPGRAELAISDRHPTVTTMAARWRKDRSADKDFAAVRWDRRIVVDVTTLDELIGRFGVPAFVKIDVEGAEPAVLGGLSTPVSALSFEYLPHALEEVRASVARLEHLGRYRFNWSPAETYRLAAGTWLTGAELMTALESADIRRPGDVYARLDK